VLVVTPERLVLRRHLGTPEKARASILSLSSLDFSRASLMHRKVQLRSSITPSYDTISETTTLLTNISFVCWADVIRQEDRSIGRQPPIPLAAPFACARRSSDRGWANR
jgi:hypothetical protein